MTKKKSRLIQKLNFLGAWQCSSGVSALSFALALPAALGGMGVAVDYGMVEMKRTQLQAAADQSAIAAVKEYAMANATDATIVEAAEVFARSALQDKTTNLDVTVAVDKSSDAVEVKLSESWTPFFAQFISDGITPIVVGAKAKLAGKSNLCVLTLDPIKAKALHMDKSARLKANGCAVYSNSADPQSIRLDMGSELSAAMVCAVGGVKAKTSAVSPAPTSDCPVVEDPLSSRQSVKSTKCDFNKLVIKSGSKTLSKGRYCGGIKIAGDAKVSFEEGDYTIADGKFEVSDSASVTAKNASFYLEGENTTLQFSGNSTIAMTGSRTGPMAGILFFEDRAASLGRIHRINSANANELTGTIYMPRGKLRIDPNSSVAADSAFTAIIAYQVEIDEGPTLVLNSNYSDTNVPVPDGIRIGAQVVLTE